MHNRSPRSSGKGSATPDYSEPSVIRTPSLSHCRPFTPKIKACNHVTIAANILQVGVLDLAPTAILNSQHDLPTTVAPALHAERAAGYKTAELLLAQGVNLLHSSQYCLQGIVVGVVPSLPTLNEVASKFYQAFLSLSFGVKDRQRERKAWERGYRTLASTPPLLDIQICEKSGLLKSVDGRAT